MRLVLSHIDLTEVFNGESYYYGGIFRLNGWSHQFTGTDHVQGVPAHQIIKAMETALCPAGSVDFSPNGMATEIYDQLNDILQDCICYADKQLVESGLMKVPQPIPKKWVFNFSEDLTRVTIDPL